MILATFAALAFAYVGMTALCLAMSRHHREWCGAAPSPRRSRALRIAGAMALALSLLLCFEQRVWSIAIVCWFGLLSAAALLLVFAWPYAMKAAVRGALLSMLPGGAIAARLLFDSLRG